VFRHELGDDFTLIAIHTDRGERFRRLTARARDDDPAEESAHQARDDRELDWGLARTIALADEMIVNDGTLESFHGKVGSLLEDLA
jgi:dephospho-CoA kinase